jgi:probable HAF family extracellular repeat protein
MALVKHTKVRRGGLAAIVAAVILTALAVVSLVPARATAQPAASEAVASADGEMAASRKGKRDGGIRGHGFVRDGDVFTTIDAPGAGSFTVVFGINASGDTAGGYVDQRGRLHGFLRRSGEITTIDFPGAQGTFAARVNDVGQVVGFYGTEPNVPAANLPHGFLLDNGVFTKIDVPGAVETRPFGINNAGQIVGEYVDEARTLHGFLFAEGVYTTIDAPDSTATQARDIDDGGRIVGISVAAATGAFRGFLRDAQGAFTAIDAPAAPPPPGRPESPTTQPFGINNLGQVIGVFTDSEGDHSFVMDNGVFTTIAVPDAVGRTLAYDINDSGPRLPARTTSRRTALSRTGTATSRHSITRTRSEKPCSPASTIGGRSSAASSTRRILCEAFSTTAAASPRSRYPEPSARRRTGLTITGRLSAPTARSPT